MEDPPQLDHDGLARLLRAQQGVVSRRQVLDLGGRAHDLRRLVRRRELFPIHAGVYINHNGTPSWIQQAWAAVQFSWPAVLWGPSAVRAVEDAGTGHGNGLGHGWNSTEPIHVAVSLGRHLKAPRGVRLHRLESLDERAQWNLSPPRIRYEQAVLDVALTAGNDVDCVAALARPVQSGRTTATRLQEALTSRARVPRRDWLAGILDDLAAGTSSTLEHGYLELVERAHGFPAADRQVRESTRSGVVYRDVAYAGLPQPLIVELDGQLFHSSAKARDRDFERDLDLAVDGRGSIRLTFGQVFDRPCSTAAKVGLVLIRHGWAGRPQPCGEGCPVAEALAG